ncbi:MAG: 16S rRNA (guanine(966)-N(2))-methyltransferase RsmD [Myxococcales bacterium]
MGGRLGGRRIAPPPGNVTRPTSERVREALTSALSARGAIEGARVVDLFAGSGALGFEMLSRGATQVLFVERDARVAEHIRMAAQELDVVSSVRVLREDIGKARGQKAILALAPFDLVLLDPPYREVDGALLALEQLCRDGLLAEDAVLLLEHAAKGHLALPTAFAVQSSYRYGDTAVEILTWGTPPTNPRGEVR